jgi:chromosome segregation ATPase
LGVPSIPEIADKSYDFTRLERAVRALAEECRRRQAESASLRNDLVDKGRRIRALDEQLLHANQLRQDVAKRVDELIARIDALDAQLDESAEA